MWPGNKKINRLSEKLMEGTVWGKQTWSGIAILVEKSRGRKTERQLDFIFGSHTVDFLE